MNTKEILIAARAKIEKPENWTKHAYGRDAKGESIMGYKPDAICWCIRGAFQAVEPRYSSRMQAILLLESFTPERNLVYFNDNPDRTHEEVLQLFDKAIAKA